VTGVRVPDKDYRNNLEQRRKKHRETFSNYENAVTVVSSLEEWFMFRWGPNGRERAGLLDYFDRFPDVDGLTPDFEARFHTPYYLWGDYKRTIQPVEKGRDDVAQIIKYALRRPSPIPHRVLDAATNLSERDGSHASPMCKAAVQEEKSLETPPPPVYPNYDVVVLVMPENDDIAAESIHAAREAELKKASVAQQEPPDFAPVIVLGCHRDAESISNEWYKLKWRSHHHNARFSTPNIAADLTFPDLNALICDASHHPIPVNKSALNLTGRTPFMNDSPPPIYTAIRLVIPAINALLTDDERDRLQSIGRVEKTMSRNDILGSSIVIGMRPQPRKLAKWIDAALDFMQSDLGCAKRTGNTTPPQFSIVVDSKLLRSDVRDLWAEKAATKGAKQASKRGRQKRRGGDGSGQLSLWE
jgi:hypothetical protein